MEPQFRAGNIGFFRRVWLALKFVFFKEPNIFAETLVSESSIDDLSRIIVSYRLLKKLRAARKRKV